MAAERAGKRGIAGRRGKVSAAPLPLAGRVVGRSRRASRLILRGSPLLLLCALAACGGGNGQRPYAGGSYSYAPPGPPEDPWGPYIHEASQRFTVPERWIRAVMHQESGGHEYLNGQPITSDAGATGLMQVMPATYAELRAQYNLGDDPYNPHDNIMAGTAYIREMYEKYGSPAFLAAYNAGPQRVEDYLAGRGALPNETVNYLASIAPHLGTEIAMTGPLAVYGGGAGGAPDPVPQAYASAPISRCWRDPDAAYDPDAPCRSAPPPVRIARAAPAPSPSLAMAQPARAASSAASTCWHDPNAAYDPDAPCQTPPPAPPPVQVAAADPRPALARTAASCWHDPDAAYDPTAPCQPPPAPPAAVTVAPASYAAAAAPSGYASGSYAQAAPAYAPAQAAPRQYAEASLPPATPYGQTTPGRYLWGNPPAPQSQYAAPPRSAAAATQVAAAAPPAVHHSFANYLIPQAAAAELPPPRLHGAWSIQVGAFSSADEARNSAANARALAPHALSFARTVVGTTAPFGGHVLYRARLAGLSVRDAQSACSLLTAQRQACVTVPPGG